jgi:hypothetical protein
MSATAKAFGNRPFTSTMNSQSSFNLWIVIITAVIFYAVLSWYNFISTAYNYVIDFEENLIEITKDQVIANFGFAIFWSFIAFLLYKYFNSSGLLTPGPTEESNPLINNYVD